jgi:hypothetical protein
VVAGGEEAGPLMFAFLGTSKGNFQSAPTFATGVEPSEAFAAADFNGDGNVDLALAESQCGGGGFQTAPAESI